MKYLLFFALVFFVPSSLQAASLSTVAENAALTQTFSVTVMLAPEGEALNVVEGTLYVPEGLTVESVSTSGSALTLWPVTPVFNHADRSIVFTGGVPGAGLAANGTHRLFTLRVRAEGAESYAFQADTVFAYKADGSGTRSTVSFEANTIAVAANGAGNPDPAPSASVYAEIGQDPSLFDNARYVFAYGTGITRYEVKEGWFGSYVPADQYYVLTNQKGGTPVFVRATDEAGKGHSTYVRGSGDFLYYGALVVPVLVLIIIGWVVYRRLRS